MQSRGRQPSEGYVCAETTYISISRDYYHIIYHIHTGGMYSLVITHELQMPY